MRPLSMRPLSLAVLFAAPLLATACHQKASLAEAARAAVAQALADSGQVTVQVMRTDPGRGVVCGLATAQDETTGAVTQRPFIQQDGAIKLYHSSPDWNAIRQLANMDSGGDQAAFRLQIDEGCGFPAAWRKACGPAAAPIPAPDPELCRLWRAGKYQQLFDHVRQ